MNELENQRKLIEDNFFPQNENPITLKLEDNEPQYDVFISHATEDKEEFVRPLADELIKLGVKVWYDEFSMDWGDSLRKSIDKGLANSKYGVVVLSTNFINKSEKWPGYELNGLVAKEIENGKTILPIWHKVTKSEVMKFSPTLADKVALNSSMFEISDIAEKLKNMLPSS